MPAKLIGVMQPPPPSMVTGELRIPRPKLMLAIVSTLVAARLLHGSTRLRTWAGCQSLMGIGVLLPTLSTDVWTIAASAVLVGGTFMVATTTSGDRRQFQ
jgi:hypothetical protein